MCSVLVRRLQWEQEPIRYRGRVQENVCDSQNHRYVMTQLYNITIKILYITIAIFIYTSVTLVTWRVLLIIWDKTKSLLQLWSDHVHPIRLILNLLHLFFPHQEAERKHLPPTAVTVDTPKRGRAANTGQIHRVILRFPSLLFNISATCSLILSEDQRHGLTCVL